MGTFHKISLAQVQKTELELLHKIAEICDAHDIRYYLATGTLLGAVRHKGFIPWDDDIDLLVPRPDYEKLLKVLKTGVLSGSYSCSCLDDTLHFLPFLKVFYNPSKVIERKLLPRYRESKIWMDIFPLDGISGSPKKIRFNYWLVRQLKSMLYTVITDPNKLGGHQKLGTYILRPLAKLIGLQRIGRWMDTYAKTRCEFSQAHYVGNVIWAMTPKEVIEKEKFLETVDLPFEDGIFHCPACHHEYLEALYGDYMTPPPVEQRREHLSEFYFLGEDIG
jgi:lipopolysaccharide cholinephosphotransferase